MDDFQKLWRVLSIHVLVDVALISQQQILRAVMTANSLIIDTIVERTSIFEERKDAYCPSRIQYNSVDRNRDRTMREYWVTITVPEFAHSAYYIYATDLVGMDSLITLANKNGVLEPPRVQLHEIVFDTVADAPSHTAMRLDVPLTYLISRATDRGVYKSK